MLFILVVNDIYNRLFYSSLYARGEWTVCGPLRGRCMWEPTNVSLFPKTVAAVKAANTPSVEAGGGASIQQYDA